MPIMDLTPIKPSSLYKPETQTETICVDFIIPTHIVVANEFASNSQFEERIETALVLMLPAIRKFAKITIRDEFLTDSKKVTLSITLQK